MDLTKTQKFTEKAKEVHGDKYDYKHVDYKCNKTKVSIICPEHGTFEQIPHDHLRDHGCPKCGIVERGKKRSSNNDEFIEKAKKVHGDKYDYKYVDYKGNKTKITIICQEHGPFEQTPDSHLNGSGCLKCAQIEISKKRSSNTDEFTENAKEVHGDKYDYSEVDYKGVFTKITIICQKHGIFQQRPNDHLNGNGCPKCGIGERAKKQTSNTDEFIEKAKEVHGDKYDYKHVDYKGVFTKITIICQKHGIFQQRPNDHLNGNGCPKCGIGERAKKRSSNTDEFTENAKEVHSDKYEYDQVDYKNSRTKITIICPEHGIFQQRPNVHLRGQGCPKCAQIEISKKRSSNTDEFIEKAKKVHGDKYDYKYVDYKGNKTKITIICQEHGPFEQTPDSHLNGSGCLKCAQIEISKKRSSNTDEFTENAKEVHSDKYEYDQVDYKNSRTKITIICPEHGIFQQKPNGHLNGRGCPKCAQIEISKKRSSNNDEFIEKAKKVHGDKYDYSQVDYKNAYTKITIICQKHGIFQQKPNGHLNGRGCPKCLLKTQTIVWEYLKTKFPEVAYEFRVKWCKNPNTKCYLPFDICIKNKKIIVEVDGYHHFEDVERHNSKVEDRKNIDSFKEDCVIEHGYSLIRVVQEEIFNNTYDWKSELLKTINMIESREIYCLSCYGKYD